MDVLVSPLEFHVMIFGLDFLRISKEPPLIHEIHLVFLDKDRTTRTLLKTKRNLKRTPTIYVIRLVEGVSVITNEP